MRGDAGEGACAPNSFYDLHFSPMTTDIQRKFLAGNWRCKLIHDHNIAVNTDRTFFEFSGGLSVGIAQFCCRNDLSNLTIGTKTPGFISPISNKQ